MESKLEEIVLISEIMAFEDVAGISLSYDENTFDRQPMFYQTVLRFPILLKEMFSKSSFLGLMEK